MKSIIKDLLYKIEGYGDSPEYDVESIRRSENAIVIVIRLPQPEAAATEQTAGGAE